ncbi:hypothetical protein [Dactylosporangium sp. CS-033363]|uniref:hypothetical protein n=1 Tax=Dactylosporangium sp. CS-033363 TaxID=3239935 RepID=UPI003D913958
MQEVGTGNTFTKEQLRRAFPGLSQADRRMRDLRPYGWVISTNTDDATLLPEEHRFVSVGVPVWDSAARREADLRRPIPAKDRDAILARDHYMCTVCGIAGGEEYLDDPSQTAVLSVSQRVAVLPDGDEAIGWATECKRCRAGASGSAAQAADVIASIQRLSPDDRQRLVRWMIVGRREASALEQAWIAVRRLPPEARQAMLTEIGE